MLTVSNRVELDPLVTRVTVACESVTIRTSQGKTFVFDEAKDGDLSEINKPHGEEPAVEAPISKYAQPTGNNTIARYVLPDGKEFTIPIPHLEHILRIHHLGEKAKSRELTIQLEDCERKSNERLAVSVEWRKACELAEAKLKIIEDALAEAKTKHG